MEVREGRIGNAFACERCRKHKVRCVPSEAAGLCQRCQKARVECIEHVARRRPAKPRAMVQTPHRASDVEAKVDSLTPIATAASPPNTAPQPIMLPLNTVPSQAAEITHRTPTPASAAPPPPAPPAVKPPILPNPGSTPESALSFWDFISDTVSGLGRLDPVIRSISVIHMQMLLDTYRAMVDFFPFVPLPKESFCRDLLQQRPMLMFAVLTVSSYDSVLLQLTLSREFRKVVMVKIMNGEKSLDLLQGLLVFIAWHHHYMDPQAVSIHMLLQICVGIAGDLGLDTISATPKSPYQKADSRDREAKRAHLGCYYLASNLSCLETGRARSVSYSSALRAYAAELASTWEYRSDMILPILIDTCQFTEDIDETFRNHSEQALVVRSQLKRLSGKWDNLRLTSKQQAQGYKTLQWLQLGVRIYLYKTSANLELPDRDSTPWASGFQLSQRITCLRAIEQFLDNALQTSSAQFEYISIIDYLAVLASLTGLGKLALHQAPIPGWDPVDLQITKTFDYYRDQLANQMPRRREGVQDNHDETVFERFRRVSATVKTALKNVPSRASPNGSTFEITTSSRQTVSLLQEHSDLPPLKPNGSANSADSLPAPWKITSQIDMSGNEFLWKFLLGTV